MVLIPELRTEASSFSAATSFTYNYQGDDYQFYFSGLVDSPDDYYFDSSVCDYIIQKSAEGINISIASGLGAKINNFYNSLASTIYNFYRNFMIATSRFVNNWISESCIYGWTFEFSGSDSNYSGHETYGTAYGWTFTGWAGEKIDLVLDSQGMIYGSNPIGNYTFSDDQRDFGIWSIHQYDDGDLYVPENESSSYQSLLAPYIQGESLFFYLYLNGQPYKFELEDFGNTYISWNSHSITQGPRIFFYCPSKNSIDQFTLNNLDGYPNVNFSLNSFWTYLNGNRQYMYVACLSFNNYTFPQDFILPSHHDTWDNPQFTTDVIVNSLGSYQSASISGSYNRIFLSKLTTSPLPDPIVLPVDEPIPVSNIDPDPVVFDPDPEDDPDPVPGVDYPDPGPLPWPIPDIPPIVSGNDDIWPDLNLTFDLEDGLLDLTGNLSNFEWPTFSGLIDNFTNALVWVSSIMTLMYSGTEFSVLFNILAVFFIAAAILGLYKWWNK